MKDRWLDYLDWKDCIGCEGSFTYSHAHLFCSSLFPCLRLLRAALPRPWCASDICQFALQFRGMSAPKVWGKGAPEGNEIAFLIRLGSRSVAPFLS